MGVYFGKTEITNIDNLVPQTMQDITQAFFGSTEVFTVWATYDGTLPATYTANGSALADYRIYGAAGGVGDDSGTEYGYEVDIRTNVDSGSNPIFISEEQTYVAETDDLRQISSSESWGEQIEAVGTFIIEFDIENSITSAEKNTPVVRLRNQSDIYEFESPENYLNAGHYVWEIELNSPGFYISSIYYWVKNANANLNVSNISLRKKETITTIYIGSSPLNAYEYINYASGKIYRKKENLFIQQAATQNARVVYTDGSVAPLNDVCVSDYIEIDSGETYTLDIADGNLSAKTGHLYAMYDSNKNFVNTGAHPSVYGQSKYVVEVPNGVKYIRFNTLSAAINDTGFYLGIGVLTPTDPPVPLPALPTVDGTTITDYAGQSAAVPSRFTAKYRKEGF